MSGDEQGYYDAKERDRQKARVEALFVRWIKRIGLGWWTINVNYDDAIVSSRGSLGETWSTVMVCDAQWEYMQATISVSLSQCHGVPDDELERFVVHELMHVFLSEMREKDSKPERKHEERVACTLTNAFMWLRDMAMENTLVEQIERATGIKGVDLGSEP